MSILFLTVKTFSASSGTEKVCRIAGRALYQHSQETGENFVMHSLQDDKKIKTEPYLPGSAFKGFSNRRFHFIRRSLGRGTRSKFVVLSHINLLTAGYVIKLLSPKTKLVLIAQAAGSWKHLSPRKQKMLKRIDRFITISDFTKEKIANSFGIAKEKFSLYNNCLDPFLPAPADESRRKEGRHSYGIDDNDFVLMTLSSLSKEKSKGFDKVLIAIKKLQASFPNVKYLFVGKYRAEEKARLDGIISDLGIEDAVIFTGFVPDAMLADFYNMSDVYIMPGEREGFGFPFINALYYNKPVIAGKGNDVKDDQYSDGLGTLIDFRSQEEITNTIKEIIDNPLAFMPDRELVMKKFSYTVYREHWEKLLEQMKVES